MEQSPRLSLSYVAPNQAQKHVTVNESFRRLDALVQAVIRSRTETSEPASPVEGDAYVIPSGASGAAWSAYDEGDLAAFQDGAWARIAPFEGLRVWVADDDELVIYDGAAWGVVSGGGGGSSETAAKFGINTTADATNKLAAKSDAVLFNHDDVTPGSGDCQVKINKAAAGDTGTLLFQTGASGRAEFGLAGDDDFHLKVSADGAAWIEAVVIDKDTGAASFEAAGVSPLSVSLDDTTQPMLALTNYASSAGGGNFTFQKTRGTKASPSAVNAGDTIGGFFCKGYHSSGDFSGNIAFMGMKAHENFTAAANGTSFEVHTTSDGAVSRAVRMIVHEGLVVGAPTGGDKGEGTINAVGVYDDNTILSCYVFDQALDGVVDAAKWDGKVPDRRIIERDPETGEITRDETIIRNHEPMRKFTSRIGTNHDPLTLDGYARHWKERRHLAAMPNEADFDPVNGQLTTGEWIQRLVETAEIQAVLIEELNSRVAALTPPGKP